MKRLISLEAGLIISTYYLIISYSTKLGLIISKFRDNFFRIAGMSHRTTKYNRLAPKFRFLNKLFNDYKLLIFNVTRTNEYSLIVNVH